MKALQKMKIVETVIVVERHDMIATAERSSLWPAGGTVVDAWMGEDECLNVKVHVSEPEEARAES